MLGLLLIAQSQFQILVFVLVLVFLLVWICLQNLVSVRSLVFVNASVQTAFDQSVKHFHNLLESLFAGSCRWLVAQLLSDCNIQARSAFDSRTLCNLQKSSLIGLGPFGVSFSYIEGNTDRCSI